MFFIRRDLFLLLVVLATIGTLFILTSLSYLRRTLRYAFVNQEIDVGPEQGPQKTPFSKHALSRRTRRMS